MPARITVVDAQGALAPVQAAADPILAIRPGVVYTATGEARLQLPDGEYTVWASRGVEYDAQSRTIRVAAGGPDVALDLRLTRAFQIPGWAAGDVHVHTLERSGHGDATLLERAVTLAGEGLEFAVSTEHNLAEDFTAALRQAGLDDEVTSIPGVEFTTPLGHFNLFPVEPGSALPDPSLDWDPLWRALRSGVRPAVVMQNHPRDLHAGYRPMDDAHYLEDVGEWLNGRTFPGNAIEVVNSGAMQSDPLQGVRDWLAQLNRGARVAGMGTSDSHDVARIQVGQARTYVRAGGADGPPAADDVVSAIVRGETVVSYGLVASLEMNEADQPFVRVHGPQWVRVREIQLYANGEVVATRQLTDSGRGGLKWSGTLPIPSKGHDVWLAAVAIGEDVQLPFWSVAAPYQPSLPVATPMTLGVSQAVPLDGDADGRFESARAIAERLVAEAAGDAQALERSLSSYDAAVAAQARFSTDKRVR